MSTIATIVADVRAWASSFEPAERRDLLLRFVDAWFEGITLDELAARSVEALYAAVCEQFELLCAPRQKRDLTVVARNLDGSEGYCDTALLVLADDMTFIVDTVSMAVREAGADIDWMMHPILRVSRNAEGVPTDIRSAADSAEHGD